MMIISFLEVDFGLSMILIKLAYDGGEGLANKGFPGING